MILPQDAFAVPVGSKDDGTTILGYGAIWSSWLVDNDEFALVVVADSPAPSSHAVIDLTRMKDGVLAVISDPAWQSSIAVPIDESVDPSKLTYVDVYLFSEKDATAAYETTLSKMESILKKEMALALKGMEPKSLSQYIDNKYPEYVSALIAEGELTHAEARMVSADAEPEFITLPVCRNN